MKEMKDFLSKRKLLHQKSNTNINYIDSCFLTTNIVFQKAILGDERWFDGNGLGYIAHQAKVAYTDSKGIIRRYPDNYGKLPGSNPDETKQYNNPNHVSRDNSMGMAMMTGYFGYKNEVRAFMWNILKRGSFFQNTHTVTGEKKMLPDFCGPEHWAVLIRSGFSKGMLLLLYPVILVLDFFYMLSYLWHVAQSYYDPTHSSTVLHMLSGVLMCRETVQTPFSYIAEYCFINFRKPVPGYEDKESIVSALKYYSRFTFDPPIYLVGARVLEKIRV